MIYILIRSRTKFEWVIRSIQSALTQEYNDFKILFVDDASDYTREQQQTIRSMLKGHVVVFNQKRKYSPRNGYEMIHKYVDQNGALVVNLDGDDFWVNSRALKRISEIYQRTNCLLAYGECRLVLPNLSWKSFLPSNLIFKGHNTRYDRRVEVGNEYRQDPIFRPLHPRSWKAEVFKRIEKEAFLDNEGNWLTTCEDQAMFFPMLEMSGGRYAVDNKILYGYRWDYFGNNYRYQPEVQRRDEQLIRSKKPYQRYYD